MSDPRPLPDDFTEADVELWGRVAPYTMTSPGQTQTLARAVEYVVRRPVPGAFVECGVWRGGSVMAMALTLLRLGRTDRDMFLFDTFEGMTEPDDEVDVKQGGRLASEVLRNTSRDSTVWGIASIDEVKRNVFGVAYPRRRVHFVPGLVEQTVPDAAPDEIALLRLDTDWHSSTKHELEHLYPRLTPGGVLILDDYAYWRGARQAVDEYIAEQQLVLLLVRNDGARVAIKT